MISLSFRKPLLGAGVALALTAAGVVTLLVMPSNSSHSNSPANAPPAATPVSVAVVEQHQAALWDEFSGRLEAVERVEVRSRVAGALQSVHFREGALVGEGDRLITIDPAPYAAEVDRAEARLSRAKGEYDRGRQLWDSRNVS